MGSAVVTNRAAAVEGGARRVLVVAGDEGEARHLQIMLGELGHLAAAAPSSEAARAELAARTYDLIICDVAVAADLAEVEQPLIAVADADAHPQALDAIDAGACDCLVRPFVAADLALAMRRAERFEHMRRDGAGEARAAAPTPASSELVGGMVGVSRAMREVFTMIDRVARHKATVLITGESGTGKELVARAIHDRSPRAKGRFVAINCGAIPANLLESELFGHRRGAFTDAVRDKSGLFEEADGGTLFLDEIGELPLGLQVKLLRAIQEEEIRRIGDNTTTKIDARVIAATLRDLSGDVRAGRFREDLFYRLNVLPVHLPPLRERPDDIPALVDHFIRQHGAKQGLGRSEVVGVTEAALRRLVRYSWPGNIRELENTIERAMVLCDGPLIDVDLLADRLREPSTDDPVQLAMAGAELSIKKATRAIEQELIRRALDRTSGNRTNAAKLLEISHRALLYKIKEYGI